MIELLTQRRSLEGALADLRVKYEKHPSGELARMIEQLHAEIAIRRRPPKLQKLYAAPSPVGNDSKLA